MSDTLKLTVTGMTCGGCENAVKRTLLKLPGVQAADASHAQNSVTATYDPALVTRQQIADAIAKLGYVVVS